MSAVSTSEAGGVIPGITPGGADGALLGGDRCRILGTDRGTGLGILGTDLGILGTGHTILGVREEDITTIPTSYMENAMKMAR